MPNLQGVFVLSVLGLRCRATSTVRRVGRDSSFCKGWVKVAALAVLIERFREGGKICQSSESHARVDDELWLVIQNLHGFFFLSGLGPGCVQDYCVAALDAKIHDVKQRCDHVKQRGDHTTIGAF
jgi:hypothetical protein